MITYEVDARCYNLGEVVKTIEESMCTRVKFTKQQIIDLGEEMILHLRVGDRKKESHIEVREVNTRNNITLRILYV